MVSPWRLSHSSHPTARGLADRHYNRQKPGTQRFVKPGACIVLLTSDCGAVWATVCQQYVKHAWPGAWENSLFRRESGDVAASALIRLAVAHTLDEWGEPPSQGLITFIDPEKVRTRTPGYCYLKAGFRRVGMTDSGLLVFRLSPDDMPDPVPVPIDQQTIDLGAA